MALTEDELDSKWGTVSHYLMSPTLLMRASCVAIDETSVWRTKNMFLTVYFAG